MSATVPLDQILNAKTSWVRDDPTKDLDSLIKSIKEHGLQEPVLLAPDFLVIDGARRVLALQALGVQKVPVVVTNDWGKVRDYFIRMREVEKDWSYRPMLWLEMNFLITTILRPLYAPVRAALGVETRRHNKRHNLSADNHKDKFSRDLAEMLGLGSHNRCKTMVDISARIRRIRDPLLAASIRDKVNRINVDTGELYSAWRLASSGTDADLPHDTKEAQRQLQQMNGIADVMEHLIMDASTIRQLNPAISEKDFTATFARLKSVRRRMGGIIRLLGEQRISGERSNEENANEEE